MGRYRSVDGSPTVAITIRIPAWALERLAHESAGMNNTPVREWMRDILLAHLRGQDDGK